VKPLSPISAYCDELIAVPGTSHYGSIE